MSDSVRPHRLQPTRLPVPGILQARTLEWVAIAFSIAWKWKVKVKLLSSVRLLVTQWTIAYQAPLSMGFSRQKYWSGVPLPFPSKSIKLEKYHLLSKWCYGSWTATFKSIVLRDTISPYRKTQNYLDLNIGQTCPAESLPSNLWWWHVLQMISNVYDLDYIWNLDKLYLIVSPSL